MIEVDSNREEWDSYHAEVYGTRVVHISRLIEFIEENHAYSREEAVKIALTIFDTGTRLELSPMFKEKICPPHESI